MFIATKIMTLLIIVRSVHILKCMVQTFSIIRNLIK